MKLEQDLPKDLFYHGIHHTLDVLEQAERIAKAENISGAEDLMLLKVACLYHDRGFLITYSGHEEVGCKMAKEELPVFHFADKQIKIICGLIMATKIPQTPHTK
ncbi:MAG: HD domain-containing protein, partial [Bacteroidia bacterium]|nr:HD domain-containing protein [Bacteroidia bacterium]